MKHPEPIRVAHIIGKWVGGGVESVVMNYYRNIDKSKIQFDFICDSDSTSIPYEEIEKMGGRVFLIPPYQKIIRYHKKLKKILNDGRYKIVHSHINTLSVFSLWAAKRAGIPIRIAHNHATTNKKEIKRNIIKTVLRPFSKLNATKYMCCSENAGRWLFGNKLYNQKKVILIKNAIDIEKFIYNENIRDKYRKKIGVKPTQMVVGHVGRMVETKNHTFILNVFSELCKRKDATLVLIGQGPLENKIKEKVKELHIEEKVLFLGQKEDVNNWYQAFDVFILPSLYEGFGLALLEAQASNLPCIASTNVPVEAKLINDFKFLPLETAERDWADSIIKLAKPNQRKSNKNEFIRAGFDIYTETKKLEEYYLDFIKEV